jgi:GcrA cell cycle regulator
MSSALAVASNTSLRQRREEVEAPVSWTDERIEKLKLLWQGGLSTREIAEQLGGVTRNGVIGKAHRLQLPRRAQSRSSAPKAQQARAARVQTKALTRSHTLTICRSPQLRRSPKESAEIKTPPLAPTGDLSAPASLNLSLMALGDKQCHWPTTEVLFCGHPTSGARSPYCEYHQRHSR